MVVAITIITQDENKILPNLILKRIIGRRTQFYQRFKFNKRKLSRITIKIMWENYYTIT
jgi:hypothetical protein